MKLVKEGGPFLAVGLPRSTFNELEDGAQVKYLPLRRHRDVQTTDADKHTSTGLAIEEHCLVSLAFDCQRNGRVLRIFSQKALHQLNLLTSNLEEEA